MGLVKRRKSLSRELRLMRSTLRTAKTQDVSETNVGRTLMSKGFIGKSGKITDKGRRALRVL